MASAFRALQRSDPYAILSHTWGQGEDVEVTYADIVSNTGKGKSKPGYRKLRFCSEQAARDGLDYFWVDTCCTDKSQQAEYGEAIKSMFRWYQGAERCYVYLSDVSMRAQDGSAHVEWQSAFRNSRWFRRGWTLQELLAPKIVEFYSRDCIRLGDKISLLDAICTVTSIDAGALTGQLLSQFSIEERLRWGEGRETAIEEDQAHYLLGIFDVHLPLIPVDGGANAMRRLLDEVHKRNQYRPFTRGMSEKIGMMMKLSLADYVIRQLPLARSATIQPSIHRAGRATHAAEGTATAIDHAWP